MANVFDNFREIVASLGTFWASTYGGSEFVEALVRARLLADKQAHDKFNELLAACSRTEINTHRRVRFHRQVLSRSACNRELAAIRYGDGEQYGASAVYGGSKAVEVFSWPTSVVSCAYVVDRVGSSRVLAAGHDFAIENGLIVFREDPFVVFQSEPVFTDGVPVDESLEIWLEDARIENYDVFTQFGYVLGLPRAGGEAYKRLVNAMFDAVTCGPSFGSLQAAVAAMVDAPVTQDAVEVVEAIIRDGDGLWVVTDKRIYTLPRNSTVVVSVGERLARSQPLCDAVQIYPARLAVGVLPAISLPAEILPAGVRGPLTFFNEAATLSVSEQDGKTRIDFFVGGWPGDAATLFAELHRHGVRRGETLANLLDVRPVDARVDEPQSASLPSTINPMAFALNNVLGNNAVIVKVRPGRFGARAMGLSAIGALRGVMCPGTLVLVCSELAVPTESLTMGGVGNVTSPGYTEDVSVAHASGVFEEITGVDYVTERLNVYAN